MFFGRPYRQKRKVLLQTVPATPSQPPMSSVWRPPVHNVPGIEKNWYESCWRSHASMCGCGDFINHLNTLANSLGRPPVGGFPPGQGPSRVRALPAPPAPDSPEPTPRRHSRTENPTWRGGDSGEDAAAGPSGAGGGADDEGDLDQGDVAELLELLDDPE